MIIYTQFYQPFEILLFLANEDFVKYTTETYWKLRQTSKMELFVDESC